MDIDDDESTGLRRLHQYAASIESRVAKIEKSVRVNFDKIAENQMTINALQATVQTNTGKISSGQSAIERLESTVRINIGKINANQDAVARLSSMVDERWKALEAAIVSQREDGHRRQELLAKGLKDVSDKLLDFDATMRAVAATVEARHRMYTGDDDALNLEVSKLHSENAKLGKTIAVLRAAMPTSNIAIIVATVIAQLVIQHLAGR